MQTTTLEDRMRRLEKQVARQRRILAAIIILFLVFGVSVSFKQECNAEGKAPAVVKAEAFVVVDDTGAVLAELTARGNAGMVATYTDKGKKQTVLGTGEEGGGYITCFNKKGEIQVNLGGDQDGGQIVTNTTKGLPRVVLSGDESGGIVYTFNNEGMPQKRQ